jgi:hypothetical protein
LSVPGLLGWAIRQAWISARRFYSPRNLERQRIHVWIRQNVLAFVSPEFLSKNPWAREIASQSGPLSIVHPELFTALIGSGFAKRRQQIKSERHSLESHRN